MRYFSSIQIVLFLVLLLPGILLASSCSVWNPWGYSKDWPFWKKTLFFVGPGHCPPCYIVGGAFIEIKDRAFDGKPEDGLTTSTAFVAAPESKMPAVPGGGAPLPQITGLPRLVDLGAKKCIPCKAMAPILEELELELQGRLDVVFIDVWENARAGEEYGIRVIPTQIFYSAEGQELVRHEGFLSRQDILAKWKDLGVDLHAYDGQATATINTTAPS